MIRRLSKSMIRAVLFDLDRTLLDRDTSFQRFVESQHDRFAHALAHVPRQTYVSRIVALDDRGRVGKKEVYQKIANEFQLQDISWQELFADFDSRIADYYVPFPGLRETLQHLLQSGYRLGLVTNGLGEFQMRTLRALGIEHDFATILISEWEGLRKPQPEIFLKALRNLACTPGESVFIGDHAEVDIQGAHEAGLRTIWKINDDFPRPLLADAVFHDLDELPSLLQSLGSHEIDRTDPASPPK